MRWTSWSGHLASTRWPIDQLGLLVSGKSPLRSSRRQPWPASLWSVESPRHPAWLLDLAEEFHMTVIGFLRDKASSTPGRSAWFSSPRSAATMEVALRRRRGSQEGLVQAHDLTGLIDVDLHEARWRRDRA